MAGLPAENTAWPTPEWALVFEQYAENDAWTSDDQAKLQAQYQGIGGGQRNRGDSSATHYNKTDRTLRRGGLRGYLSSFFNGRIVDQSSTFTGQHRTRVHAPMASNIATLSADLLMAEPPTFRLLDAKGKPFKGTATDRLDKILNGAPSHRTLHHAAELTAGLSATVLTAHWDKDFSDTPWMQATACDAAIPEFRAGRLVAVNLYTLHINSTGPVADDVYIHVERHEVGRIIHGLYKTSTSDNATGFGQLGKAVPLSTIADTEHLENIPGSTRGEDPLQVVLPTGIDILTASWWRNRPTKTFRKYGSQLSMVGRADSEGVEQLLDAVDEVWSSWMRDIKIARARLIVPESFLDVQGPGLGGAFDDDAEILTPLAFTTLSGEEGEISAHQFKIRAAEHAATLLGLTKEITQAAGYSLSSYGEQSDQGGVTATETVDRTTLTERTRDKKFLYFEEAANPLAHALMALDAVHYGGQKVPAEATLDIEITELSQIDPEKEARIFQYLRSAMAASTRTLVKMQHPDWEEKEINREVLLIQGENNLTEELDPATVDRVPGDPAGDVDPTEELDENGQPIAPGDNPLEQDDEE